MASAPIHAQLGRQEKLCLKVNIFGGPVRVYVELLSVNTDDSQGPDVKQNRWFMGAIH